MLLGTEAGRQAAGMTGEVGCGNEERLRCGRRGRGFGGQKKGEGPKSGAFWMRFKGWSEKHLSSSTPITDPHCPAHCPAHCRTHSSPSPSSTTTATPTGGEKREKSLQTKKQNNPTRRTKSRWSPAAQAGLASDSSEIPPLT